MPFFTWTDAMSVGVPVLDSDHKALIDLINSLHEGVRSEAGATDLDLIFERLVTYVDYHFAREESVMEACDYPASADHREQHLKLAQDMRYFRDRHVKGGETRIGQELLTFLRDWLNHHILIQDMHYKKYAVGNPRAEEAAEHFGPGLSDPRWEGRAHLLNRAREHW
jgi:hemerythrin-like metal-binding protein